MVCDNMDGSNPHAGVDGKRAGNPTWVRGGPSPNPGGRPTKRADLTQLVQSHGPELIAVLLSIALASETAPRDRISASQLLLAYGFAKPTQGIEICVPENKPMNLAALSVAELRTLREMVVKARAGDVHPPAQPAR